MQFDFKDIQVLQVIDEFDELKHRWKNGDNDCYDLERLHPNEATKDMYTFIHWDLYDSRKYPSLALSQMFMRIFKKVKHPQWGNGYGVLRVIKNHVNQTFGKHVDINYETFRIASVTLEGQVIHHDASHFGLQAEKLVGVKAQPHLFNPYGGGYNIVYFHHAPFSTLLDGKETVGEYIVRNCL